MRVCVRVSEGGEAHGLVDGVRGDVRVCESVWGRDCARGMDRTRGRRPPIDAWGEGGEQSAEGARRPRKRERDVPCVAVVDDDCAQVFGCAVRGTRAQNANTVDGARRSRVWRVSIAGACCRAIAPRVAAVRVCIPVLCTLCGDGVGVVLYLTCRRVLQTKKDL